MRKITTTMIRPKLEYAEAVWSPHKKKHTKKLERIERISTKLVSDFKKLTYEERWKEMQLITLEEKRGREDLIIIYKLAYQIERVYNEALILLRDEKS